MELLRALGLLAEPPTADHARIAALLDLPTAPDAAGYTETFLLHLYPYASVHLGAEGMLGGEARDRVAGFHRALGATPPTEPDHLAALLGAYAELTEREGLATDADTRAAWRRARAAFLWEHILSWSPVYLARVADLAASPYDDWAHLLTAALTEEARAVGPPSSLPLPLRVAPGLPDPRTGGSDALIEGLLATVRLGWFLTTADLARAGHTLGTGIRVGERRYVIRALLGQEPAPLLEWLSRGCRAAAGRWKALPDDIDPIKGWWTARATAAAGHLEALSEIPGGTFRSRQEIGAP